MKVGFLLALTCGAALTAGSSCRPVLQAPPPLIATTTAGQSTTELLEQARASFARRRDPEAVRQAEEFFLAAARSDPECVEALYGAIQAEAWLSEHEIDTAARVALAKAADDAGQWCIQKRPHSALCTYGLAIAMGLSAREHPTIALQSIKPIMDNLRAAAAVDDKIDHAGPHRVLALVLTRVPGWPVGPGDVEQAVVEARRAVELDPDYSLNQLALAETLIANGEPQPGRAAADRAIELARKAQQQGDPDAADWLRSAQKLLGSLIRF